MELNIPLKDLISPFLVFLGLILNGLWLNSRLERVKSRLGIAADDLKDMQKNRREGLFKLRNSCSVALSAAKAILDANAYPIRHRLIEALLPSLSEILVCIKTIDSELSSNYLDKNDVRPYAEIKSMLFDYFFMLDNTKLGDRIYVARLQKMIDRMAEADAKLIDHNGGRLRIEV
jgi:hypothetical protein